MKVVEIVFRPTDGTEKIAHIILSLLYFLKAILTFWYLQCQLLLRYNKMEAEKEERKVEYVTLNNGVKMPVLSYGTYQTPPGITEKCVTDTIHFGYRSIDTAQCYGNCVCLQLPNGRCR